jgi:hypothetical protein
MATVEGVEPPPVPPVLLPLLPTNPAAAGLLTPHAVSTSANMVLEITVAIERNGERILCPQSA